MDDMRTYHIQIRGQIEEAEVNALSPLHMTAEQVNAAITLLVVRTDQSGLIGLLRHLHGLGFELVSVESER